MQDRKRRVDDAKIQVDKFPAMRTDQLFDCVEPMLLGLVDESALVFAYCECVKVVDLSNSHNSSLSCFLRRSKWKRKAREREGFGQANETRMVFILKAESLLQQAFSRISIIFFDASPNVGWQY